MAIDSRLGRSNASRVDMTSNKTPAFGRHDDRPAIGRRMLPGTGIGAELDAARSSAAALLTGPRSRCRVSQVQTSASGQIQSTDEVLGLILQRPSKSLVGLPLAHLIAGPERRFFDERTRVIVEGPAGSEWETRVIAPGARIGVPVAISVEKGDGSSLRWYIRDLSELRRAQARVMELEQLAARV